MNNEKQVNLRSSFYILKTINKHGIKVALMVCELPAHILLHEIDFRGNFNDIIISQISQIILGLRGELPVGVLISTEKKYPEFPVNNEDLILVMFQKEYQYTTRTVAMPLTDEGHEKLQYFSNVIETNQIFKDANGIMKYKLHTDIDDRRISFQISSYETKEILSNEIDKFKSKIM